MGDLAVDTAVEALGDGRYSARLSRDWEIWGPMGGYVAAVALRAAGAESTFPKPASFFCHYLGVAAFDVVDLTVTRIRTGRTAESLRVSMTQGDRPILDATVSTVAGGEGLEHEITAPPVVPGPDGLLDLATLAEGQEPPFPFWRNFEARPIEWRRDWPPPGPEDPVWQQWERFVPTSTFADPWVDAARTVLLVDLPSWPSAYQHHAWRFPERQEWIAPSLDLYVAFHQAVPDDPWLLIDGHAPIAAGGLIGWTGRLWSSDRKLVASGGGQALCRRVPGA